MRFKILLLSACLLLSGSLYAQTQEPDFIGEVYHMDAAGHATLLEKQHAVMKTEAGASLYLFGIGKVKTKINVKNGRSSTRFPAADTLRLVVKAVDNASDPMTIVQVFRFKASSKSRKAEVSSSGSFSGDSDNNLDLPPLHRREVWRKLLSPHPHRRWSGRIRHHRAQSQYGGREEHHRLVLWH